MKCNILNISNNTLINLIRDGSILGSNINTQLLHCHILKSGYFSNGFILKSLINSYSKLELISEAHKLFDEIAEPTVVSWNTIISGYVRSGQCRNALYMFLQLEKSDISSDSYSLTAALSACGQLSLLQFGRTIHSKIVKLGEECNVVVANCLIDMYGKCGYVDSFTKVFNQLVEKDNISWNSVIAANVRNQKVEDALGIFRHMPNADRISYNEIINGVALFGEVEDAVAILYSMPCPNSSSWNSIITGYVNRGRGREALDFFSKMHLSAVEMDQFTFSTVLSGIASIAAVTWGTLVHCRTMKYGLDSSIVVGSALLDMYFKCGRVKEAELVFRTMPKKNLITWNTMISGYAHNGSAAKAIELYELLVEVKDLQPDDITFLNVLSACWHNRIPLSIANQYIETMIKNYGIHPTVEHCCVMVRLMGQEGDLSRAEEIINKSGFDSCGSVWRALLSACVTCRDIEVAKMAARKVIELERDNEFVYVQMSNIYASHGEWRSASELRKLMFGRRVMKEPGCSWVELDNII
ncbi:hypothetical protein LIER_39042 [Lithospermum erythrorhizon]|uniref:Pentatricopeptide repeat-containing protein n=1 Tax=Lithospermum erythrorhizon TaxID=34254 RepID=A0AAV3Q8Q2_LITER